LWYSPQRLACQKHYFWDFAEGSVSVCDYGPFVTVRVFPAGGLPVYNVSRLTATEWRLMSPEEREGFAMVVLKRPGGDGAGKGKGKGNVDKAFAEKYPYLWAFLSAAAWEDGTPRQTSTLTLFADGGVWSAAFTDRDTDQTCWGSALTLDDLLAGLEGRVQEAGSWRKRKGKPGAQKRS
jgi:hypothetical protein